MMEAAAGQAGKARQYFRRASETDPRHLPTLQAWARLEAQQGQLDAARVKFQQALTVDSTHIPSWQVRPLPQNTPLMLRSLTTSTPTRSCGSLWRAFAPWWLQKQGLIQCLLQCLPWTSSESVHTGHMQLNPSTRTDPRVPRTSCLHIRPLPAA